MTKQNLGIVGVLLLVAVTGTYLVTTGITRASAAPIQLMEGLTAEWQDGGWKIVSTLIDPGTKEGTQITLTAEAVYYRDGSEVPELSVSEPVILTVGKSEYKKVWMTKEAIPSTLKIAAETEGSGGAEITTDGKLKWWVTTNNDGTERSFTFKLVLK
jgi:hypothetical protein